MRRLPRGFNPCVECGVVTEVIDERGWCLPCAIDEVHDLAWQIGRRILDARRDARLSFLRALEAAANEWERTHG